MGVEREERVASGQAWQETTGRWRCSPVAAHPEEVWRREKEGGGAERSSGLEKAGVSDCRGHTNTHKGGGLESSGAQIQIHDYTHTLLTSQDLMWEFMHVHRNTVPLLATMNFIWKETPTHN